MLAKLVDILLEALDREGETLQDCEQWGVLWRCLRRGLWHNLWRNL